MSYLTARAARINSEIQRERESRASDICRCGHSREYHAEFQGACCVGTHHCFSFQRDEQASTSAALQLLRESELL